jgi:hypothetical protein
MGLWSDLYRPNEPRRDDTLFDDFGVTDDLPPPGSGGFSTAEDPIEPKDVEKDFTTDFDLGSKEEKKGEEHSFRPAPTSQLDRYKRREEEREDPRTMQDRFIDQAKEMEEVAKAEQAKMEPSVEEYNTTTNTPPAPASVPSETAKVVSSDAGTEEFSAVAETDFSPEMVSDSVTTTEMNSSDISNIYEEIEDIWDAMP